jgi:hypothetical protein
MYARTDVNSSDGFAISDVSGLNMTMPARARENLKNWGKIVSQLKSHTFTRLVSQNL